MHPASPTFIWQSRRRRVFLNPDPRILLYKRFIDDLIIVWEGEKKDVEFLLIIINQNDRNISLTWEIDEQKIHFLDLEIRNTQHGIETISYFKDTDRNSYIPMSSCHYKPWITNFSQGTVYAYKEELHKGWRF